MDKIRILESENSQVKWCDLEGTYNEEAVDWIRPINEKIVQKSKEFKKMREIKVGNVYKHFKNKYYIVLDIVNDCESNNDEEYKKIIIYKALYGEFLTWARPYEMFASEVDHDKYPDIKQKYRFEEVEIEDDKLSLLQKHIQEHNEIVNSKAKELSKCINLLPKMKI